MPNHLFLIDGSGYIFRAYHKLPPLTDPEGTPVGAVLGFANMLAKLHQDLQDEDGPTHMAVIFDAARKSFRNDIYPNYKAHRPPAPEDLVPQFPLTRDATRAMAIPCIEMSGYEADDIIASYTVEARKRGWDVTIVSSDKDLMQLVGDGVDLYDSMKNARLGPDAVVEKFGVGPDKVIEVQALMGDSADNVPGVPGIGPKTAAELINAYGDLETLLAHAGEIPQTKRRENLIEFADQARMSKQLVTLKCDIALPVAIDDMALRAPDPQLLGAFLDRHDFRKLKAKLLSRQTSSPVEIASAAIDVSGYECVTTLDRLQAWISDAKAARRIAVDTETTGLDAMRADLVGISLCVAPGKACYIPLGHQSADGDGLALMGDRPPQLDLGVAIAALKPLLADPSVLKVGQNIKYDAKILARHGVVVTPVDDTMLMSYVLDSGRNGHGMDELSQLHLGHKPISYDEVTGQGRRRIGFAQVALDAATRYAAEDADVTLRLADRLKPRLLAAGKLHVYETLERPLIPVLVAMERAGIKVDRGLLAGLSREFAGRMAAIEAEIHQLAGHEFNIGSPKQLGEVLFDELGLPAPKRTKTGAFVTDAETLEKLAEAGHALPTRMLDWRQLAKLKSTYADALQAEINDKTGRVHTSYHMASTSTGRLSSNEPNLQNIPIRSEEGRRIRQAFIAEPGHILLAADYSQIELRLLADIADIPALKQAFADGLDIHAMTASQVFGVPVAGIDKEYRRRAKAINFGIIYGISAFGLARQLGISRGEAQGFIDTYFARFPGIRAYMDDTIAKARRDGFVETRFGRRIHTPGIADTNPNRRGFAERAAINAPIQGAAADIIRRAMIRLPAALYEAGLGEVAMLLQVHDELVFELPSATLEAATNVVKRVMEGAAAPAVTLSVPLVVEVGHGDNWDQAH